MTRHHVLERRVEGDGRLDGVGLGRCLQLADPGWARGVPLGPLGFNSPNIAQRHALRIERTADISDFGLRLALQCRGSVQLTALERMQHIQDSQGQILILACR